MTSTVERAIIKLRSMEPEQQQYVVELLDTLTNGGPTIIEITPAEQAIIDRALAEIDAGEVASEDEVAAYRYRVRG
jgi:predicted transcriptional regulator